MIALAALDSKFEPNQRPKEFDLSDAIPQSEDTGAKQPPVFANSRKRKQANPFNRDHSGEQTNETSVNESEADNGTAAAQTTDDLSRFE